MLNRFFWSCFKSVNKAAWKTWTTFTISVAARCANDGSIPDQWETHPRSFSGLMAPTVSVMSIYQWGQITAFRRKVFEWHSETTDWIRQYTAVRWQWRQHYQFFVSQVDLQLNIRITGLSMKKRRLTVQESWSLFEPKRKFWGSKTLLSLKWKVYPKMKISVIIYQH